MGAGFSIRAKANQTAEILIYEDVGAGWFGGVSAKQFADDLKGLGDVKAIDVRINSYGGDVFEGLAIYRQLVKHPATITTHVDGVAASIASIIAMAGTEIRIAEAGWMMIHDAWGMSVGNAADMRRQADLLDSVSGELAGVYEARTGHSRATVLSWMAEETWLNAEDAIDKKFATTMAENLRMAASTRMPDQRFRRAPVALSAGSRAAPAAEESALRAGVQQQVADIARRRTLSQHRTRGAG